MHYTIHVKVISGKNEEIYIEKQQQLWFWKGQNVFSTPSSYASVELLHEKHENLNFLGHKREFSLGILIKFGFDALLCLSYWLWDVYLPLYRSNFYHQICITETWNSFYLRFAVHHLNYTCLWKHLLQALLSHQFSFDCHCQRKILFPVLSSIW